MSLEYFAGILLRIFVKTLFPCNVFARFGIRIISALYSNWEVFLFPQFSERVGVRLLFFLP